MTEPRFKVGDRVRITRIVPWQDVPRNQKYVGKVGKIIRVKRCTHNGETYRFSSNNIPFDGYKYFFGFNETVRFYDWELQSVSEDYIKEWR